MSSPYDILIDIKARADEVQQAVAAISGLVDKASSTGAAVATSMAQGQAATQELTRDIAATSAAVGQLTSQGTAAGSSVAAGMNQGAAAAQKTSAAVAEVAEKTKEVSSLAEEASGKWAQFGSGLKDGLTLGFGTELAQKAIEAISEIPKLFVEATEKGVEFDKEMETLGIGLAGALRQAQPEKYLSFTAARSEATTAIAAIQAKANALGLDFKSVGEAVQTSMLPLVEGGITNINQQIEVMTLLMQASAAKGVTGFQAQRDAMDILAGRAERVMLGRELGITNDDIKRAQEAGTLYDFLTGKLAAYQEAGVAASTTFAGLWQSVQNLVTQLEGSAAKPFFDGLKSGLADVKSILDSIDARGNAQGAANIFGGLIDGAKELYDTLKLTAQMIGVVSGWTEVIDTAENVAGALSGNPLDTAKYAAQLDANQRIVLSLEEQVRQATNAKQIEDARRAVALAIGQAQQQMATAEGDQKTAAETLLTSLQAVESSIGRTTTGTHEAAGAAGEMTSALGGANKELGDMLAKLPAIVAGMRDAASAAGLANRLASAANSTQKLGILEGERQNQLGYISDNAKTFNYGPVKDTTGAQGILDTVSKGDPIAQQSGQAGADALQNIIAGTQKLQALDQQIAQIKREQTSEDQKQAVSADQRAQQEAIFAARASGNKTYADQLDRAKDIQTEALRISKDEGKNWDDAVHAATEYVDLQNKAKDAADAEKNSKRESAAANKEAAAAARDQRMEDSAADRERKTALQEIKNQLADIKGDPFQTDAQKIPQELRLLEQERQQLLANIKARQDYINAHQGDPGLAVKSAQMQGENVQDQRSLAQNQQQTALLGGGGQIKAQLTQLQNQWALTSANIGKSITTNIQTAVDGVSNALDSLIMGTHNWRQAFAQAGSAIIKNLIQLGVQMIANAILGRVLGKSAATEQATNSATITAAAAPAAATTSISSYGVAAIVGAALAVAAIAAIIAMATSHAEGGLIPGAPSHKDNRFAHVASGEYVVRTAAVQHYGPDFFHRLNSMSMPRTGFASGGLVGANDGYTPLLATVYGGSPNVSVGGAQVTLINPRNRSEYLQALESSEGEKIVINHIKKNRTTVGIKG